MVKIKDIPAQDRPIERLLIKGVDNLNNEELLSILIKTGTKKYSVKEISNIILSKTKNIQELEKLNLEKLLQIDGIGTKKACTIIAAIELGKRINKKIESINNIKITSSQIVFEYYKNTIASKEQEHFLCIYLNNSKKVIKEQLLFIGTLNHSLIHPREIFKEAYKVGAASIICIHNHPSGNIIPSKEDYTITKKLIEIGKLLGINIDDHIIISKDNYYSFYENDDIR
ncbi:MAG: RadC family protein [Bacilli bacterium]